MIYVKYHHIKISKHLNFEDWVSQSIGQTLYSKFFEQYSKKMWGVKSNKEIN